MAEVFAAVAPRPDGSKQLVALKRPLDDLVDEKRFVDMFIDEARLAVLLQHPNCVQTIDLNRDDRGQPYLVMELIVGAPVSRMLKGQGAFDAAIAAEVGAQAGDGLHYAHEAVNYDGTPLKIVHRDVSPQNLLVGVDGRVRVADFGVARAVMRITKTKTGQFKGKLGYVSPEQATGQELDRRSDVFGLGVVTWEMMTGRRLFRAKNLVDTYRMVVVGEVANPLTVNPNIPEGLATVVMHALARDRNQRYQDAASFAAALRSQMPREVSQFEIQQLVWQRAGSEVQRLAFALDRAVRNQGLRVELPAEMPVDPDAKTIVTGQHAPIIPEDETAPTSTSISQTSLPTVPSASDMRRPWWRVFLSWFRSLFYERR